MRHSHAVVARRDLVTVPDIESRVPLPVQPQHQFELDRNRGPRVVKRQAPRIKGRAWVAVGPTIGIRSYVDRT
jgi:hypothetical protein